MPKRKDQTDSPEDSIRKANQRRAWADAIESEFKEKHKPYDGPDEMSLDLLILQLLGRKVKAKSDVDFIGRYD
jgi:hypothetical protein